MSDPSPTSNDTESESDAVQPTQIFVRSFLTIIMGVAAFLAIAVGVHAAVVVLFFPDEAALLSDGGGDDEEEVTLDGGSTEDGESTITDGGNDDDNIHEPIRAGSLFWIVGLLINLTAATIAGLLMGRFAPASPMGHAVFLAALLFLTTLQQNDTQVFERPAWALAGFAFGVPISVLAGAWFASPAFVEPTSDDWDDDDEAIEQDPNDVTAHGR